MTGLRIIGGAGAAAWFAVVPALAGTYVLKVGEVIIDVSGID